MRDTTEIFHELSTCGDAGSMRLAGGRRFAHFGFERWSLGDAGSAFVAGNYPRDWRTHYQHQGYLELDPVVSHCRQRSAPCLWSADPSARGLGHTMGFFPEAVDFGLRVGLGLPVHGAGEAWSMVTVARRRLPGRALTFGEIAELHLLATLLHEMHRRIETPAAGTQVHLTQREIDALRFAAEGKTSWEIGRMLGIGERTVVFHLANAAAKLGVVGRRQAIARAIALNLFSF